MPYCLSYCHLAFRCDPKPFKRLIEGFGGTRVLGVLLKSALCQKRFKFPMQFCLGALNNVLYVFLLKFASVSKYITHEKNMHSWSRQHVTAN